MVVYGASQLIRLVANLITARLLVPEMFGVMAIVQVFIQGVVMFSDLGLWAYIVRNKDYKDVAILNTVWTMQVVQGWFMFLVIIACALILQSWQENMTNVTVVYSNKSLPMLLMVISLTAVLKGYKTLAPAVMSRELKRGRLEVAELLAQFSGTVVMVLWAWYFPSIWALASASIVTAIMGLILNYVLFDISHKHSWDKKIVRSVFHFGKWIFLASSITFLAQQSDKLFFSAMMSSAQLGVYSIAFMMASFITTLIQQFTTKIWLPVFSSIKDKSEKISEVYYSIRMKQDIMVSLGVILVGLFSPLIIELLYDERYSDAGWMMQILLISSIGLSVSSVCNSLLLSLGCTKVQMQVMLVRVLSLVVLLPLLYAEYSIKGAIYAVAIISYIGIPVQYITMKKLGVLSFKHEFRIMPLAVLIYIVVVFYQNYVFELFALIEKINFYEIIDRHFLDYWFEEI